MTVESTALTSNIFYWVHIRRLHNERGYLVEHIESTRKVRVRLLKDDGGEQRLQLGLWIFFG